MEGKKTKEEQGKAVAESGGAARNKQIPRCGLSMTKSWGLFELPAVPRVGFLVLSSWFPVLGFHRALDPALGRL